MGGESERAVDELERAFAERGIRIVRDKKDLDYKGSIEAFEQRIGQGQCIVLVISDKYLRSEHCMYELLEVDKNLDLRERIFPIVLADARIYKAKDRLIYIRHWDEQIEQLNQAIKQVNVMTNLAGITTDLDKYARIRANFDHLTDLLSDMNALTPEMHAANGFSTLISSVERAMAGKQTVSQSGKGTAQLDEISNNRSEQLWKRKQNQKGITAAIVAGIFVIAAAIIAGVFPIFSEPIRTSWFPTSTPNISLTATADARIFKPELTGGLANSSTPNWDLGVEKAQFFRGAYQLIDVPIETRDIFGDDTNVYYLWLMVENVNRNTEKSCGKEISFRGPQLNLLGKTVEPFSGEAQTTLQRLFPSGRITTVVSNTNKIILRIEGQLLARAPAQGPVLLFFYPTFTKGDRTICSGEKLGIPIGAFHYVSEGTLLPEDYLRQQIGLSELTIEWKMLSTVSPANYREEVYLITTRDFLPMIKIN